MALRVGPVLEGPFVWESKWEVTKVLPACAMAGKRSLFTLIFFFIVQVRTVSSFVRIISQNEV